MSLSSDALTSLEFLERLLHHSQKGEDYPHREVSELSLKTCISLIRAFLNSQTKDDSD